MPLMDANGTRYHLLLGYDDWTACTFDGQTPLRAETSLPGAQLWRAESGLDWNVAGHEVTLRQLQFDFPAARNDTPPSLDDRRGAARDAYGNWYWIAASRREILVESSGSGATSHFWASGDGLDCPPRPEPGGFHPADPAPMPAALELAGLAITADHYLAVGVLEPAGLLIFDLHAGGPPSQVFWPAAPPLAPERWFVPFDMAPAPGGGVWILDRANGRYWGLDRRLNVLRQDQLAEQLRPEQVDEFQPEDGDAANPRRTAARSFPSGILLNASSPVAEDPIAIEALPDGTVLILSRTAAGAAVARYRFGERLGLPVDLGQPAHDFAFVPAHAGSDGPVPDRLYVAATSGNQAYVFDIGRDGDQLWVRPAHPPQYRPMRLFGGKALVAVGYEVYYDFADTWIPLVEQRRPRYVESATLYTPRRDRLALPGGADGIEPARPAFDGREPGCVWHRLLIDACIPPETHVLIWSRAADEERDLALTAWQPEPRPYQRGDGSELPYVPKAQGSSNGSELLYAPKTQGIGNGTWELLFQRARGRFLQLKLELHGNGRTTPRIRALRAYYPRFSYLRYLPAVYRDDELAASFLDRFLANLEGLSTALEDKIAAVQLLFDVRSVPAETLDWLAGWYGVALDPAWDEARRRLFIRYAMTFFQYRGTIPGLLMALRLTLDECVDERTIADSLAQRTPPNTVRVVETFRTRRTPAVIAGNPTTGDAPLVPARAERWTPDQGVADLNKRYIEFVDGLRPEGTPIAAWRSQFIVPPPAAQAGMVTFPIIAPQQADAWRAFAQQNLGFVPAAAAVDPRPWQAYLRLVYQSGQQPSIALLNQAYGTSYSSFEQVPVPAFQPPGPSLPRDSAAGLAKDWAEFARGQISDDTRRDQQLWQAFLSRRYQRVSALAQAYGLSDAQRPRDFAEVLLPSVLPADGVPLYDWYQFESVVLPMRRTAHQFTVLLPMPSTATRESAVFQQRLELAKRIVQLEKPAHTIFDVRLYWAMFRVGEARLGADTLLDEGSRSAKLLPPLILGQEHLAESYLVPGHPQNVQDRLVIGQGRLS
jgi:phage tail-like protein